MVVGGVVIVVGVGVGCGSVVVVVGVVVVRVDRRGDGNIRPARVQFWNGRRNGG